MDCIISTWTTELPTLISKTTFYHLIYSFTTIMSLNMAYGKHQYKRLTCSVDSPCCNTMDILYLYHKLINFQQQSVIISWIRFWRSRQCRYCHLSHWCARSTANILHPSSSTTSFYSNQFVWKLLIQKNLKLQSAYFLFVTISARNLQLQSFMELSTFHELSFNSLDTTQCGWAQCLRRVWACQSPRQCRYWHSESQIILFGSMTNIRIFTAKSPLY